MRNRLLKFALLTVALASVVHPATAGPYRYHLGTAQAAVITADLYGGGTATAWLLRLTGPGGVVGAVSGGGVMQALPAPVDQEQPALEDEYVGCVVLRTPKGRDFGCRLMPPSTVDFDPLMNRGQVTFQVKSDVLQGGYITVNLLMTGTGTAPTADQACRDVSGQPCSRTEVAPRLACSQTVCTEDPHEIAAAGQAAPLWLNGIGIDAQHVLSREMDVVGTVRSKSAGGGAVVSADLARVYSGAFGTYTYETGCLVLVGPCRV